MRRLAAIALLGSLTGPWGAAVRADPPSSDELGWPPGVAPVPTQRVLPQKLATDPGLDLRLELPEALRFPIPVLGKWIDPESGRTIAPLEGVPSHVSGLRLADAATGIYRGQGALPEGSVQIEVDARARTVRRIGTALTPYVRYEPYVGPVSLAGTTATLITEAKVARVVGRRDAPSRRVFEIALPMSTSESRTSGYSWGIEVLQDCFHVFSGFREEAAMLLDVDGRVIHRREGDFFIDLRAHEADRLYVSLNEVGRMRSDGSIRWKVQHARAGRATSGGLLSVQGGDVLAYVYTGGRAQNRGASADGPLLLRVNPTTGLVVWEQDCAMRGVSHSFYSKDARVEIRGHWVYVISMEAMASFVEVKLLSSGETIRHWRL